MVGSLFISDNSLLNPPCPNNLCIWPSLLHVSGWPSSESGARILLAVLNHRICLLHKMHRQIRSTLVLAIQTSNPAPVVEEAVFLFACFSSLTNLTFVQSNFVESRSCMKLQAAGSFDAPCPGPRFVARHVPWNGEGEIMMQLAEGCGPPPAV